MIYHAKYMVQPLTFTPFPNPMVSGEEMNLLLNICLGKPRVLEIGTWKGITTANILLAGCDVVTIDVNAIPATIGECQDVKECLPVEEIGSAIPENLRKFCKIALYNPNEPNGLKELMSQINQRFDLIIVDGDHSYHGVTTDYRETLPYLKEEGVMLFHDCWWDVLPHPVSGPMKFMEEMGGMILNRSHYGMLLQDLEKLWLI